MSTPDMNQLPDFVQGHQLATLGKKKEGEYVNEAIPTERLDEAEVVTSYAGHDLPLDLAPLHRPVLDIDFPAALLPSTTPGHFHLFLDKKLTWEKYARLLSALADAGIIEEGYEDASYNRQFSSVRLPWVKKNEEMEL